jgi:hypothetical protein
MCIESNPIWCSTPGPTGINDAYDVTHPVLISRTRAPLGVISRAEAGEPVLAGPWADAAKTAAKEVWGLLVLGVGNVPAMVIRIVRTGGYIVEAVGVVIESPKTWKIGEKIRTAAEIASIVRDVKRIIRNDDTVIKVITRATRSAAKASELAGAGKKNQSGGGFGVFARAKLYRPHKPDWMTQDQYSRYLKERWIPYGELPKRPDQNAPPTHGKMDYAKMTAD